MNNYGLISIIQDRLHWFFTNADEDEIIQPGGQWDAYLPVDKIQNMYNYDPYSCTSYGTINAIEILMKRLFDIDANYSERGLAIASDTKYPGNDPHTVCESIRKLGLVDDDRLPVSEAKDVDEYYKPNPLTEPLRILGKMWVDTYAFNHYWVFENSLLLSSKIVLIKEALKYSPIGVSVHAWQHTADGIYYKDEGTEDNHWCVIYGYNSDGTWKCFDSLDMTHKILSKDYNFSYAKMFSINLQSNRSLLSKLFDILKNIFS